MSVGSSGSGSDRTTPDSGSSSRIVLVQPERLLHRCQMLLRRDREDHRRRIVVLDQRVREQLLRPLKADSVAPVIPRPTQEPDHCITSIELSSSNTPDGQVIGTPTSGSYAPSPRGSLMTALSPRRHPA